MIIMSDWGLLRFVRREVRQWWRDGHVHLAVAALAGLLCFLPIFTGQMSQLETDTVRGAISSRAVGIAACVCLSMTAPLMVDVVLDARNKYKEASKKRKTLTEAKRESEINETKKKTGDAMFATFTEVEKFVILVGCAIGSAAVFQADLVPKKYMAGLGLVNICARNCQIVLIGGAMICAMQRFESLWTPRRSFVVLLILAASSVLTPFANGTLTGAAATYGRLAVIVLFGVAALALLLACIKWIAVREDGGGAMRGLLLLLRSRGRRATAPVDVLPADANTGATANPADSGGASPKKKSAKETEKEAMFENFRVRAAHNRQNRGRRFLSPPCFLFFC